MPSSHLTHACQPTQTDIEPDPLLAVMQRSNVECGVQVALLLILMTCRVGAISSLTSITGPLMSAGLLLHRSACCRPACVSETMLYTASASASSAKRSMSLHTTHTHTARTRPKPRDQSLLQRAAGGKMQGSWLDQGSGGEHVWHLLYTSGDAAAQVAHGAGISQAIHQMFDVKQVKEEMPHLYLVVNAANASWSAAATPPWDCLALAPRGCPPRGPRPRFLLSSTISCRDLQ